MKVFYGPILPRNPEGILAQGRVESVGGQRCEKDNPTFAELFGIHARLIGEMETKTEYHKDGAEVIVTQQATIERE